PQQAPGGAVLAARLAGRRALGIAPPPPPRDVRRHPRAVAAGPAARHAADGRGAGALPRRARRGAQARVDRARRRRDGRAGGLIRNHRIRGADRAARGAVRRRAEPPAAGAALVRHRRAVPPPRRPRRPHGPARPGASRRHPDGDLRRTVLPRPAAPDGAATGVGAEIGTAEKRTRGLSAPPTSLSMPRLFVALPVPDPLGAAL